MVEVKGLQGAPMGVIEHNLQGKQIESE
jgi:hypothetical protein